MPGSDNFEIYKKNKINPIDADNFVTTTLKLKLATFANPQRSRLRYMYRGLYT